MGLSNDWTGDGIARCSQVNTTHYASFLVRIWREDGQETVQPGPTWQGEVEHIQTSQRWTFDTLDELLRLLRQETEETDPSGRG